MTQNIKTKYRDMFFNPACAPPGPPGWASGAEQAPQGNPRTDQTNNKHRKNCESALWAKKGFIERKALLKKFG